MAWHLTRDHNQQPVQCLPSTAWTVKDGGGVGTGIVTRAAPGAGKKLVVTDISAGVGVAGAGPIIQWVVSEAAPALDRYIGSFFYGGAVSLKTPIVISENTAATLAADSGAPADVIRISMSGFVIDA